MDGFNLSDAAPVTPQMWMVIALAMFTIIYAVFLRPMMRQKKDPLARTPGYGRTSLSRQREVERQMETLLVELSDMARQITAQLDTRAAKLQELLRQADQAIAQMGRGTSPPAAEPETRDDHRHDDVYALADGGLNAGQIAQRLDRASGEVELILALRPGK